MKGPEYEMVEEWQMRKLSRILTQRAKSQSIAASEDYLSLSLIAVVANLGVQDFRVKWVNVFENLKEQT